MSKSIFLRSMLKIWDACFIWVRGEHFASRLLHIAVSLAKPGPFSKSLPISPDQEHPYNLGTCQKFLDTTPNLLNQKHWASDLDPPVKFENHQFKSFWFGFSVTCGQNFLLLQGSSAGKESTCSGGLNPQFTFWMGKIPCRRDRLPIPVFLGFPGGSDRKESTCNVGDLGLIPG